MLIILDLGLLYHNLCHVHYIPFTCDKEFLKFWDFEKYFELKKIL
jgi:hypothetical protein